MARIKGFLKGFMIPENTPTEKDLFVALRIALSLLVFQITCIKPNFTNHFSYR